MADKRMERKHFKEIRNNRKARSKISGELTEWKEKVCDREDVNCYPDQLQEFSGEIYRDDCVFKVLNNGARIRVSGKVDRLPKNLLKEAKEYQTRLREKDEKLGKKLDELCDIYDTFPDLVDISKGSISDHEKASVVSDAPESLEE